MLARIRDFLAAPVFEKADVERASADVGRASAEKRRAARLLNTILLVLTGLTILLVAILALLSSVHRAFNLLIAGAIVTVALGIKLLMRRGRVRTASTVFVCALLVMSTGTIYVFGGVRGNSATAYFLVVSIAALLLGGRAALLFGLLSILSALGIFYAEARGAILFTLPASVDFADWFILAGVLTMETFLLRTAVDSISEGFDRAHRNAQALTQSNRALQASRDALEDRARELTEERNLISAILNTTGALVVVLDPGGRIVRFNRACEQVTGYSFDEVRGRHVWDLFLLPESVKPVKAVFRELLTGKLPNEAQDYWITRDGDRRLISWSNNVLLDDEGQVEYVIGTGIDITERMRMQEALRESEEKFRRISGSAQDAIVMMDDQGDISYWNKAAEKIFGYTTGEAIGKHLHQILVPERALDAYAKGFEGFRDTGRGPVIGKTLELTGIKKVGEEFPVEVSLSAVRIKGEWHAIGIARDITERKRMEEALRESEERYRAATEAALAGIGIVDPQENITFANLAFAEMLGYTQEELVGMNLDQLTDQEEFQRYQASTEQRKAGARSHYETRLRRQDGTVVNVLVSASPLRGKDGGFEGTLGVVIDITERKRAEHEVEERRRYLEGVLSAAPDAIVTLDARHRIVEWNPGAEKLFGYGRGEVIGANLDDLVTRPKVLKEATAFREMVMGGKLVGPVETVRYRKDGSPVDVILAGSPILVGGALSGLVAIYTDITAQKKAERALKEARERFLTVLDGIDAHIYAADMESYEILFMNKPMRDAFGESLVGRTCWEEFRGASGPCPHCTNDALLDAEGRPTGVHVWEGQNPITGKWYLNYDRAVKWADGRFVRLQVATDITERKRAEEQLQRYAAELEQANAEIKQFAYIVSHDLRAPLVNLKGFAAELRAALAVIGSATIETLPHLDEKQQRNVTLALEEDVPEALQFIDASVSRMDAFINAVLKLSRLGRREIKPEPIDTEALVRANLGALAHQIEGGGVRVTVGSLPQVVADRTSMEQIWGNLLGNAVKYLDPDRPGEIEITAEAQHDETMFHVRDNGRGIAADDMEKVFAPFRRAGKQDVPGEGMGLAYVQALVRRHGGRIWCESELGVGSTFSFAVPSAGGSLQSEGDLLATGTEDAD